MKWGHAVFKSTFNENNDFYSVADKSDILLGNNNNKIIVQQVLRSHRSYIIVQLEVILYRCFFSSQISDDLQFGVFQIPLAFSLLSCILVAADQYKVFWGLVFDLVQAMWTNLRWISHYSAAELTRTPIPLSDRNALIS